MTVNTELSISAEVLNTEEKTQSDVSDWVTFAVLWTPGSRRSEASNFDLWAPTEEHDQLSTLNTRLQEQGSMMQGVKGKKTPDEKSAITCVGSVLKVRIDR